MKRRHTLAISLLIGLAVLTGFVAATRTSALGRASRQHASPAAISARLHALDRTEAGLRRALAQKPAAWRAERAQRVTYVRPAPHFVTFDRLHSGEHEADERESEGFDD